jgi:hypothetical protein
VISAVKICPDGEGAVWTNENSENSVKINAAITVASIRKINESTCRQV